MPVVTYEFVAHVESRGTRTDEGWSIGGHVWGTAYRLIDGVIVEEIRGGFQREGVVNDDNDNYSGDPYYSTPAMQITAEGFAAFSSFADRNDDLSASLGFTNDSYNLVNNNCVNYLYTGLQLVGILPESFDAPNFFTGFPNQRVDELRHIANVHNGLDSIPVEHGNWSYCQIWCMA